MPVSIYSPDRTRILNIVTAVATYGYIEETAKILGFYNHFHLLKANGSQAKPHAFYGGPLGG
jgi:hypothetical protein